MSDRVRLTCETCGFVMSAEVCRHIGPGFLRNAEELARLREGLGRITGMATIAEARGVAAALLLTTPASSVSAAVRAPVSGDAARELLGRIRQWDHLDGAGDGPYWMREIDKVLGAVAGDAATPDPYALPPDEPGRPQTLQDVAANIGTLTGDAAPDETPDPATNEKRNEGGER